MALPISKWPAGSFGRFQCNPGCLLLPLGRKAARAHGIRAPSPIPDRLFPMARPALLLLVFTMALGLVAEAAAPGLGSTTMVAGAVGMIAIGLGGITWLRLRPLIISWWQFRRTGPRSGGRRLGAKPASKRRRGKVGPAGKPAKGSTKTATSRARGGKTPSARSTPSCRAGRAAASKKRSRKGKVQER